MKSSFFTITRFICALFTVVAILGKPYIPLKVLLIHPAATTSAYIYGATNANGKPDYSWVDIKQHEWRCDHKVAATPCGLTLGWSLALKHGCGLTQSLPNCVSAESDEDGDGWGWENEQSCVVVNTKPQQDKNDKSIDNQGASHPVCTRAAIDPDGDGWGWENESSCIMSSESRANASTAATGAASTSGCSDSNSTSVPQIEFSGKKSIDFSEYDGMNVKIHYEGKAKFLRLYLHNYDSDYARSHKIRETSHTESFDTPKFMSTYLRTEDLKAGEAYVSLSEFNVEEWWILSANAPREMALPEFNRIVAVGVDHVDFGIHKMRLDSVELVGERVSTETFLMAILLFWSGLLLVEGGVRYYHLRAASRALETQIGELSSYAKQLEEEKRLLKTRAVTDALTGSYNRAGVEQQLLAWCGRKPLPQNSGILMFDIDHFKKINDTHGHYVGDRILKSLAGIIEANIRDGDIFARWGGEEFILIARQSSRESLVSLAEKLRTIIAGHQFEPALQLVVTVSIGVASVNKDETFDITRSRADSALYKAKITRNCVSYEGDDREP